MWEDYRDLCEELDVRDEDVNDLKVACKILKEKNKEKEKDLVVLREVIASYLENDKDLKRKLEEAERINQARECSLNAINLGGKSSKKVRRANREGNVASQSTRSLAAALDGKPGPVKSISFNFAAAVTAKSIFLRPLVDTIVRTLLTGSPSQALPKQYLSGYDGDCCTSPDQGIGSIAPTGIVRIPFNFAPDSDGKLLSLNNGVPRSPFLVISQGAMHPVIANMDSICFAQTFVTRVSWSRIQEASGDSVSGNYEVGAFDDIEVIKEGVKLALEVTDSAVIRELSARLKIGVKSLKKRYLAGFLRLLRITQGDEDQSETGADQSKKLANLLDSIIDTSDSTKLGLDGSKLRLWRSESSIFNFEGNAVQAQPSEATSSDSCATWFGSDDAMELVEIYVDRPGKLGVSLVDIARTGALSWSLLITAKLRTETVDQAIIWSQEFDTEITPSDRLQFFWNQTSTGVWTRLTNQIFDAIVPVLAVQLAKEARMTLSRKSGRFGEIMKWTESEVDAESNVITRAPKASVDGEVWVYKSTGGKSLMTLTEAWAKENMCQRLTPIADILVGVAANNDGGNEDADNDDTNMYKFVAPTVGNGILFDLESTIADIRKGLVVKIPLKNADGTKAVKKSFSLFSIN